jgi:hypothetical protein
MFQSSRGSSLRFGETIPDFGSATQNLNPGESCDGDGERAPDTVSEGLNIAAFEQRLKSLPSTGAGFCAKGVRLSLNALFGGGPANGPNAKDYNEKVLRNWRTADSCYQEVPNVKRVHQDFDIRVLQPGKGSSNIYGHIEIFYQGSWYSDFNQKKSLFGRNYSSYSTYRLGRCAESIAHEPRSRGGRRAALYVLAWALNLVTTEASAFERLGERGDSSPSADSKSAPSSDIHSVSVRVAGVVWRLVDRTLNQGTVYVLEKGVGKSRREVARDTNSAFVLLEGQRKVIGAAAPKLADAYVRDWIRSDGKAAVQEVVSQLESVTALERDAYAKNGLKLADSVAILKE